MTSFKNGPTSDNFFMKKKSKFFEATNVKKVWHTYGKKKTVFSSWTWSTCFRLVTLLSTLTTSSLKASDFSARFKFWSIRTFNFSIDRIMISDLGVRPKRWGQFYLTNLSKYRSFICLAASLLHGINEVKGWDSHITGFKRL